jgi:acetylcholinesterase/cholinesterase
MVFIHGGDYYQGYGGGILYDGTDIARTGDVVVVSMNYRLGALGFLYSGPDASTHFTGNFGLRDQQAALQWVQRNSHVFGGNRSRVTIFGESAGGDSVASHLTMPSSRGLFHAAILESFPAGLPFRTTSTYPKFTKLVAKDAGCVMERYEECMMGLPWQQVLTGALKAESNLYAELGTFISLFQPFTPAVGTPELALQPMKGFLEGASTDVPIIFGSVRQEGILFVYKAFSKKLSRVEQDALLGVVYGVDNVKKIIKEYPRNRTTSDDFHDMRNHTAPIVTDSLFHCPLRHIALKLSNVSSQRSSVFSYHFDHVLSFGTHFWLPTTPICVDSVCHGDELPILFHPPLKQINATYSAAENTLAAKMQRYWTQFSKQGNPGSDATGVVWPQMESTKEAAMRFATDSQAGVVDQAYTQRCKFWDTLGYKWIL